MKRIVVREPRRSSKFNQASFALLLGLLAVTLGWWAVRAYGQIAVRNQGYVPYSDAPIYYRTAPLTDPVAKLQEQLANGQATLQYDPDHGYLRSVLKLLKVPIYSQTLVFSKTSFQYKKISPEHPRAAGPPSYFRNLIGDQTWSARRVEGVCKIQPPADRNTIFTLKPAWIANPTMNEHERITL
jgi:hypothetical protein